MRIGWQFALGYVNGFLLAVALMLTMARCL